MSIFIRPITEKDTNGVLEIYNHAIENTTAVYCYDSFSKADMQAYIQNKQDRRFPILIATYLGQVVGFATYGDFRLKPAYLHTAEHSVYIHPDHQRKGIAGLLMEKLILEAKQAGIHTMIGGIDAENQGSITFHERLGFVETGRIKEVGYKFDRWLDLVFMQLML